MKALKKLITVLTLSTLGFAFTSNAALITNWDFNVDTAFTAFGPGAVDGSNENAYWQTQPGEADTLLTWGTSTGDGRSSLEVAGSNGLGNSSGMVATDGLAVGTSTLIHTNFPITGDTLQDATLRSRLTLTPNAPVGPARPPLNLAFDIKFLETLNQEPCVVNSIIPCRDIFVVSPGGPFNQMFIVDDFSYNLELLVSGLGALSDEACSAALAPSGCQGFTTIEGQTNRFDVSMKITSQPVVTSVPEPSSILLLSLAMFGIVASSRSKHS